jgi:predicted acetyltransferase
VTYDIRILSADDVAAAYRLGVVAFGYPETPMPPSDYPRLGRTSWGAFDDDGRLVAKAIDREQSHWFGGRLVPATGVAGVAVAAEHRGRGVSTALMTRLMAGARDRGAVIGTLFDTLPWPYRRVGWEEIGALRTVSMPTLALAGFRTPTGFSLRAATESDVPELQALYREVARAGTALMDRSAPIVDESPTALLAEFTGTTVALAPDGSIAGYCRWDRAGGYRGDGTLTVEDLIATGPGALTALLAMIGGWAAVAPTLRITLPPQDPALLLGALTHATAASRDPWMLRVIDAVGAVAARGWSEHLVGTVDLSIDDPTCPWNSGRFRLTIDGGAGRLEPGGGGAIEVGPRALASLYAGASTPDTLRRAGLLTGGDPSTDAFLRIAFAGPAPELRDYF